MARTIDIEIPDTIIENYKNISDLKKTLFEDIIISEFQKGGLSIRESAKHLNMSYEEFMEFLGKRKISFITATKDELEQSYKDFEVFLERYEKP